MARSGIRSIGRGLVRLYGLTILLVLAWATFTAVHYLIKSVFTPTHVPQSLMGRAGRLDVAAITPSRKPTQHRGVETPMSHYHLVADYPPMSFDVGCRAAGCHLPMPHQLSQASRAFANFHATFLDCLVCHQEPKTEPMTLMWIDNRSGERQDTPAMLMLTGVLEQRKPGDAGQPSQLHPIIVSLLRQIVEIADDDSVLGYLLLQIDTSEPGSPVWEHAVAQLTTEMPNHMRVAYGASLAPEATQAQRDQFKADSLANGKRYQAADDDAAREAIEAEIHKSVVRQSVDCISCHIEQGGRLNFQALGYSSQRAQVIRHTPIARQVQSIREGRRFRLPEIFWRSDDQ